MNKHILFLVIISLFITQSFSQTLTIDDTVDVTSLVETLVDSNCDTTSNSVVVNDGSGQSISSYGTFTASDNDGFDLESGVILTSGTASNAGDSDTTNIVGSTVNWDGSVEYEETLGLTLGTTFNATEIEFSFYALKDDVTIDYVFASEEYATSKMCSSNEGVLILIKESGEPDSSYTNIATLPGTTTAVTVANIHEERTLTPACAASNESYIGGERGTATPFPNYSTYTTTLEAETSSVTGVEYDVKIIVVDEDDGAYDSAVFIGTIDNNQELTVSATDASDGSEITITDNAISECVSEINLILDDSIYPDTYSYEWFQDGTSVSTDSSITVSDSAAYMIRVYDSDDCYTDETIDVIISTDIVGNDLEDLVQCVDEGDTVEFDLTAQDSTVLSGLDATEVTYYDSTDTEITDPSVYVPTSTSEEISAVAIETTGCTYTSTFMVEYEETTDFLDDTYELTVCDSSEFSENDGLADVYASEIEAILPTLTSGSYTYYDGDGNEFTDNATSYTTGESGQTAFSIEYTSDLGCSLTAELNITVDQAVAVDIDLEYIEVCDRGLDGGDMDNSATFDMTDKYNELWDAIDDTTDVVLEFYPNLELAEGGDETYIIDDISDYTNEAAYMEGLVQYVGIRIENGTDCASYEELELRPRYLISNSTFNDEQICDDDGTEDGFYEFDLSGKEAEIVNGQNYEATIHETFADAEAGTNEISDTDLAAYTNTTAYSQQLWVRILDLDNGCYDYDEEEATFFLLVYDSPTISEPTTEIDPVCSATDSGTITGLVSIFDATVGPEITSDDDITLYYFTDDPDVTGVDTSNALTDTDSNVASDDPVTYYAIGEDGNGCYSDSVSFEFEVNPAPTIDDDSPDYIYYCYDAADTPENIDITVNNSTIVADQTDLTISYYSSITGADIGGTDDLIENPETDFYSTVNIMVWLRVENDLTGCYSLVEQYIVVNTIPVMPTGVDTFTTCVDDSSLGADFILSDFDVEITQGQTGLTVRYFNTEDAAENEDTAEEIDADSAYNVLDTATIYVRIENDDDSSCYNTGDIGEVTLEVGEYSAITIDTEQIYACGELGFAEFDLEVIIDDINDDGTLTDITEITLYRFDPEDPTITDYGEILSTTDVDVDYNYQNITGGSEIIYAEVVNEDGCYEYFPFTLIFVDKPVVTEISGFETCDSDDDETEMVDLTTVYSFDYLDFSLMIRPITDLTIVELNYFTSETGRDDYESDNTSTTDIIVDPSSYELSVGDNTIYLLISYEESGTICHYGTSYTYTLNALPDVADVVIEECEDSYGSNQFTIDLDTLNDTYELNTTTTVTLTYYSDYTDEANNTEISGEFIKDNATSLIYVIASDSETGCSSDAVELTLTALSLPTVNGVPESETSICIDLGEDDTDVTYGFVYSDFDAYVLDDQSPTEFTVSYYEFEDDAENETDALSNNEPIGTGTYYIRVENDATECYNIGTFDVQVNQNPIVDLEDVYFCEDNPDLSEFDAYTGDDNDTYLWTFGSGRADETTSSITITEDDVDTEITLYIENSLTGCSVTDSFAIVSYPSPVISPIVTQNFDTEEIVIEFEEGDDTDGDYMYAIADSEETPDMDEFQESNVFTSILPGLWYVHVIDLNDCGDITPVELAYVNYFRVFTPNGIGPDITETWGVLGMDEIPGTVVWISDRYGNTMTTLTQNNPTWDGTCNGVPMPSDDYWVVIHLTSGRVIKDHISLKRYD